MAGVGCAVADESRLNLVMHDTSRLLLYSAYRSPYHKKCIIKMSLAKDLRLWICDRLRDETS